MSRLPKPYDRDLKKVNPNRSPALIEMVRASEVDSPEMDLARQYMALLEESRAQWREMPLNHRLYDLTADRCAYQEKAFCWYAEVALEGRR